MIVALSILVPLAGAAVTARHRARAWVAATLASELVLALLVLARGTTDTARVLDLDLVLSPSGACLVAVASAAALVALLPARDDCPTNQSARALAALGAGALAIAAAGQVATAALGLGLVGIVGSRSIGGASSLPGAAGRRLVGWMLLAAATLVLVSALDALSRGIGVGAPTPGLGGPTQALFDAGLAISLGALPAFLWLPSLAESDPTLAIVVVTSAGGAGVALALAQANIAPWLLEPGSGRPVIAAVFGVAAVLTSFGALGAKHPTRIVAYLSGAGADLGLIGFALVPPADVSTVGMLLVAQILATALALGTLTGLTGRLSGGLRHRPILALSLLVALATLVGLPPTAGFAARSLVVGASEDAAVFVIAASLSGALGGVAALRLVVPLLGRSAAPTERVGALDLVAFALAVALVVVAVAPGPVLAILGG